MENEARGIIRKKGRGGRKRETEPGMIMMTRRKRKMPLGGLLAPSCVRRETG